MRRHDRSDRLGATESPMSSSSSSLLYAPDAFDVDVRALKVVLDLLVELSDVTVEHRTKVLNDVIHGLKHGAQMSSMTSSSCPAQTTFASKAGA